MTHRLLNASSPLFGTQVLRQFAMFRPTRALLICSGLTMVGTECISYWWGINTGKQRNTFHPPSYQRRFDSLESSELTPEQQEQRQVLMDKVLAAFSLDEPTMKSEGFTDDFLHENVVFNDHIIEVNGRKSVETLMFGLPKIALDAYVSNVEMEHYDGCGVIKCDGVFRVTQRASFIFPTLIYVEFDGTGQRVTRIEDHWHGRPFLFYGFSRGMRKITGHLTLLCCRMALGLAPYLPMNQSGQFKKLPRGQLRER